MDTGGYGKSGQELRISSSLEIYSQQSAVGMTASRYRRSSTQLFAGFFCDICLDEWLSQLYVNLLEITDPRL